MIHSTAIIDSEAIIADNVTIGPYAVIGKATVNRGSILHPHCVIADGVETGCNVEVFPGAYIGKEPKGAGALARKPEYERWVKIGDACSIGTNSVIYYDVDIGSNTLIGDSASIREKCRIGDQCVISRCVTVNYATTIGARTKVMDNSHITGNATIGSDVFISTMVGTTNDNLVRHGYAEHVVGPVIEDRVVVGVGASLLPAVLIGHDAIVAAGSVVTKDVPPKVLVAGVPARFVRAIDPE
jgi:UDP-3-O-[3-hydroxymyristoyl] glucosamine N-acyltransferase